jgi:hypothetical protein
MIMPLDQVVIFVLSGIGSGFHFLVLFPIAVEIRAAQHLSGSDGSSFLWWINLLHITNWFGSFPVH